jgi:glyoxylase-like metal-dependent hydrolase (beta-lactamase superfamily II)
MLSGESIMKNKILLVLCTFLFAVAATAQEGEISFKSTELAPGLYMLEGQGGFAGGNLGLITGDDGVVLIDDGLEPLVAVTVAAIESLTGDPVDFVINTHAHGDHTGANEVLHGKGATVVAHDNLRRQMVKDGSNRAALPELTFADAVTFHLNGHTARVFHVANAHTDGDSVIHFPEVNIIHTGDVLFNKLFPFIDLDSGGSVDGFIAAQKEIIAIADDETKIIPGHGVLANKADLQAAADMLEDAQARVKALVDAGKSQEEVLAENPLADYADGWDWGFINAERMTATIYRSLTAP